MTLRQLALAAGASEKWVQNVARLLDRSLTRSVEAARWFGLVRLLTGTCEISLAAAARLADLAVAEPPDRAACLTLHDDAPACVVIDLARYHSDFAARLAHARAHGGPTRRGRRSRSAIRWLHGRHTSPHRILGEAAEHGVDLGLLRASIDRTPAERLAMLDENAAFLAAARRNRHRP